MRIDAETTGCYASTLQAKLREQKAANLFNRLTYLTATRASEQATCDI